jgi:hypothetical protein
MSKHRKMENFQNKWIKRFYVSKFMGKIKKINLIKMHHYTINMRCEQYIECIIGFPHLRKNWLHMKN